MLDERRFREVSDQVLLKLQRDLERASDSEDFEVENNQGALTIEFEDPPAKFVVSPNSPVRQIWVSARSKSFKLDWDEDGGSFVLTADGRSLHRLLGDVIGEQTGTPVSLV